MTLTFPWRPAPQAPSPPNEYADLVARQLALLGEDPDRDGLQKTPQRVATAMAWLTQGYRMSAADVVGDALFDE